MARRRLDRNDSMPATATQPRPRRKLGLLRRVGVYAQTFKQLFVTIWRGPFWWLAPFCIVLLLFAVLLIVVQAVPGAAPFVYALF